MSNRSNIRRTIGLVFVFAVCVVFVCADLVVSSAKFGALNPGAPQDDQTRGGMMTSNTNSSNTNKATTRRRKRRSTKTAAAATAPSDDASMHSADMSGTQTDLSGTFTGTVNYPEGGVSGPATVTVTGNKFVLTPDGGGAPLNGTITAVTTRGYIAVTLMFGDRAKIPVDQSPPPLPAVSLRARMSGGHITLMSVPGEKREFSFTSSVAVKTHRKRKARGIKPPTKATTP